MIMETPIMGHVLGLDIRRFERKKKPKKTRIMAQESTTADIFTKEDFVPLEQVR